MRNLNYNKKLQKAVGRRFGRWEVLDVGPMVKGYSTVVCRCDCGAERPVRFMYIEKGVSKSCGCLKHQNPGTKPAHGMTGTPEYTSWTQIKWRCTNPNSLAWAHYGGRGITICDEWKDDFAAFYAHVGPKPSPEHSIGRIDNEKGYQPGNVAWQTRIEQANNRRNSVKKPTAKKQARVPGTWNWRGRDREK